MASPMKWFFGMALPLSLMSCGPWVGDDDAVPGAVIPLEKIDPGIDNSDWSNAQSKAAWREYEKERNVEQFPFD